MFAALHVLPVHAWIRIYEGLWDGFCVQQTSDGEYIITGYGGGWDIEGLDLLLFKADQNGDSVWAKTYGGIAGAAGYCVQQTQDEGYIVTGEIFDIGYVDLWLLKTDEYGDTIWTRTYGWNGLTDIGYWVEQTSDNGYIITGSCQGVGEWGWDPKLWILKTDSAGDTVWTRIYDPGPGNGWTGRCIQPTTDGGFILSTGRDLMKIDSLGDSMWTSPYAARCVRQSSDGGYIVFTSYLHDFRLMKLDPMGDTVWTRTYGGVEEQEYCYAGQQTTDGGYIMVGEVRYPQAFDVNVWLVKTNSLGEVVWTRSFYDDRAETGNSVQQTTDGGYIVTGSSSGLLLLIKTDSLGDVAIEEPVITQPSGWLVDNPVGSEIVIRFTGDLSASSTPNVVVYDVLGRKADEVRSYDPSGTITWGQGFSPGVYFIREMADKPSVQKVVLVK